MYVDGVFRGEWEERVAGWSEAECRGFIKRMQEYPPEAWTVKVRWVYGLVKRREERAREQANCRTYWEERERVVGKERVSEERNERRWMEPRWKEERDERVRRYEQRLSEESERVGRSWSKPRK